LSEPRIQAAPEGAPAPAASAASRPRKARPRRRTILWGALAVLVAVGAVWGVPYYRYLTSHESTDDAFLDGRVVYVGPRVAGHVAAVHVADNQWVEEGDLLVELDRRDYQVRLEAARAALTAAEARKLSSHINVGLTTTSSPSGLSEVEASLGAAGAAVDEAAAQARAAASKRDQARAALASARAELVQVQADIRAAEVQHQRDRDDLERFREMAASDTVSAQQLAHAQAAEKVSAAQLESVRGRVETRRAQVEQAVAALQVAEDILKQGESQVAARTAQREEVKARLRGAQSAPQRVAYSRSQADAAQAEIAQAQAQVEQAELNLSYTEVRAPCSGYVTRKAVEPGSSVQVGQAVLALVPREVWVVANFKETQLTRMRPGQPAEVEVDAFPGVRFRAHVDSIQRGTGARFALLPPENATGNFVKVVQRVPVKLVFDDPEQVASYPLAPGMSVAPDVDVAAPGRTAPAHSSLAEDGPPSSAAAPRTL